MTSTDEPREHDLKTWPEFYGPMEKGVKSFELRRDDREFRVGDLLMLREWDPNTKDYTGRWCRRVITYITDARSTGALKEGFVCLSVVGLQ